jgi:MSHA biogenesis protein MshL
MTHFGFSCPSFAPWAGRVGSTVCLAMVLASGPTRAAPQPFAAAAVEPPAVLGRHDPDARFDISVNNANAAAVFAQIGVGSGFDVLVAPEVGGTITITLRDTTVLEAMDSLRELFGYDFRINGRRIFVLPNTVQTRLFRINYLPGRREGASDTRVTSSSITQSGAGASGGGSGSSGNAAGGSGTSSGSASGARADDSTHVRTTSDADFWREVQASLIALVGTDGHRSVVMNPSAGVIVVRATPAELRQVEAYLKAIQINIERQVMLEAKIVDVDLGSGSQAGINWAAFGQMWAGRGQLTIGSAAPGTTLGTTGALSDGSGNTISAGASLVSSTIGQGFYGLAFQSANFATLLNFLQTQGDAHVMSSPRIATLNNQKAVLKVGNDQLFVTGISTSTTSSGSSSTSSPSLTLQPFFSGIALDVTPQIDDAGNVMMHVHPSISAVTEVTKNIDLGALGSYRLPLASSTVNETDSIVRVHDGEIVAIGGLMLEESRDNRSGLPVLGDAPVVGALFRQKSSSSHKRELVILIKPTVIVEGAPAAGAPLTAASR